MSNRKMTPRGQMSRGSNSGPAVMMMPPHIRATFMPNPPLKSIPPIRNRRKTAISGVSDYLVHFEKGKAKDRVSLPTPKSLKASKVKRRDESQKSLLEPLIETYRKEQRDSEGEYKGMNCYNTLFVGRLAYEVTERKLLREMETYGPVKDIKLVTDKETGKSKGFAFVEYEKEEDMKRAYRSADAKRMEGREIVVDVERGHTVPTWLPRRLGGGLGGTRYGKTIQTNTNLGKHLICFSCAHRLGGKDKNIRYPGRYDPNRPEMNRPPGMDGPPGHMMGRGGHPPPPYGGGYDNRGGHGYRDGPYGGPPSRGGGYGGPPSYGGRGGRMDGDRRRRRSRSRSPERGRYAPRPRY